MYFQKESRGERSCLFTGAWVAPHDFTVVPPSSFWAHCLKYIFQPLPPFIFSGKLPQNMFQQQNYFPHFPSHTPPPSNNILLTDLSVSLEYFSQSFESRRLWCSLFTVQGQPGIFPLKYLNLPPLRLFAVHIFCFSEVCGIRQRRRFCQEFATGVQQAGVRVMENSPEHKQVKFAKFYFVHPVQLVEASEAGEDQDSTFISEHFFCFAFGDTGNATARLKSHVVWIFEDFSEIYA